MKIGDKVRVVTQLFCAPTYPWIPNLVGKTGVVARVEEYSEDSNFVVKMDQPFRVHRPPEGVSAVSHVPDLTLSEELTEWCFIQDEITLDFAPQPG
jgi:hypothetical protein